MQLNHQRGFIATFRELIGTLDRYIIRQFLINFAILLFVLTALFVLIDLVTNLDEYLKAAQHMALGSPLGAEDRDLSKAGLWATLVAMLWLMLDWHGPMIVLIYVYLCGVVVIAAMGFTYCDLARKRELTAIVVSGVSMYRIAAPVIIVGGLLNAVALPIQEFIIPPLAPKLARSHRNLGASTIGRFPVRFAPDGSGNLVSASNFHPQEGTLDNVTILLRGGNALGWQLITATQAVWDHDRQRWNLIQGYGHRPGEREPAAFQGEPGAGDAVDSRGAADNKEIDYFPTNLSPKVLLARRAEIYSSLLSLTELRSLGGSGAIDPHLAGRIMHQRLSMIVLNVLVLLMGLPFFLNREPTNPLVQGMRAAAVCLGAWSSGFVVLQVSMPQLNPVASAWLPVVIFLPISVCLMQRIKT